MAVSVGEVPELSELDRRLPAPEEEASHRRPHPPPDRASCELLALRCLERSPCPRSPCLAEERAPKGRGRHCKPVHRQCAFQDHTSRPASSSRQLPFPR